MSTISIKCPNCGGELIFDPKSQKYKCEYCGSDFALDEIETEDTKAQDTSDSAQTAESGAGTEAFEQAASDDAEAADQGASAVVYTCPSCGAQIVTDQTTAATFCYYCHNPVVLGKRLEGKYLPNKVIPFKISKKEAEKRFLEYVGKKKFVPKAFLIRNRSNV